MEIFNNKEDLISDIYKVRLEILKSKRAIENANFRLNHSSSNDGLWLKIKEEQETRLQKAENQFEKLYQQLMLSKKVQPKEQFETMLQSFGVVLGMTEDINHVENSLYDEKELHQALDQTSDKILEKQEELKEIEEKGNTDLATIIRSEISYYENDLKKHYWGKTRLENLYLDEENKKRK